MCSVGIVVVRGGETVDSFYSLIHPYPDWYSPFCQMVHGLGPSDTPPRRSQLPFDSSCLRKAHEAYGMRYPEYEFFDTLKAAGRHFGCSLHNHQLHTVSEACGYILKDHHHALADAEACACIAMKIL